MHCFRFPIGYSYFLQFVYESFDFAHMKNKACLRAAAMFAVSGDQFKQSKASRSGLQLPVGRFLRWMCDVKLGRMVHEYGAVYLTAGIENLLEEILLQCLPTESHTILTATMLEHAIANNGDLWGLLQPYAHLNAGRLASGNEVRFVGTIALEYILFFLSRCFSDAKMGQREFFEFILVVS